MKNDYIDLVMALNSLSDSGITGIDKLLTLHLRKAKSFSFSQEKFG